MSIYERALLHWLMVAHRKNVIIETTNASSYLFAAIPRIIWPIFHNWAMCHGSRQLLIIVEASFLLVLDVRESPDWTGILDFDVFRTKEVFIKQSFVQTLDAENNFFDCAILEVWRKRRKKRNYKKQLEIC